MTGNLKSFPQRPDPSNPLCCGSDALMPGHNENFLDDQWARQWWWNQRKQWPWWCWPTCVDYPCLKAHMLVRRMKPPLMQESPWLRQAISRGRPLEGLSRFRSQTWVPIKDDFKFITGYGGSWCSRHNSAQQGINSMETKTKAHTHKYKDEDTHTNTKA